MNDKVLLLLIFIPVYALEVLFVPKFNHKNGFIITTKGDTINCILKDPSASSVYYKTINDSVYRKATVENISEFQFTKKHQVFRQITAPNTITPTFMLLTDSGKINLYAYHEAIGRLVYFYLFAVKNSQTVQVSGYNHGLDNKSALNKLIEDNPQAKEYLNSQKNYNNKVVDNAVALYNGKIIDIK